jgi:hypothetical protein
MMQRRLKWKPDVWVAQRVKCNPPGAAGAGVTKRNAAVSGVWMLLVEIRWGLRGLGMERVNGSEWLGGGGADRVAVLHLRMLTGSVFPRYPP